MKMLEYEAPIKVLAQETRTYVEEQIIGVVLSSCTKIGVDVDKEELLRALSYDRGQYEKGYQAAKKEADSAKAKIKICAEVIERQDAEIERLRNENEILFRNADTAFNDGLNECRELFAPEIKAEAYKEFAERLKETTYDIVLYGKVVSVSMIDNLLKEMVRTEK